MMSINFLDYKIDTLLPKWPVNEQLTINTLNPHSFCVAEKDNKFKEALKNSDILIPDGIGIVWAARVLKNVKIPRIAGADMHEYLLDFAEKNRQKIFYLGASNRTLNKIKRRISMEYPAIEVAIFSPEFKHEFSEEENLQMISVINEFSPDILFIGMTAPKQEKWVFANKDKIKAKIIASIGAVFDFYAGTVTRAPKWIIKLGLEWLYRFIKEPRRLWKRYLINNTKFVFYVLKEKYTK